MKKNGKKILLIGIRLVVLFAVWTVLIKIVDVQPMGQNGTDIGLATLNCWFHKLTGVHMTMYTITDWMGLVPVLVCIVFGGMGCVQLVRRRSLLKVDYDILILGIYYVVIICSYLIFEMIPINYRPILIEGRLEVSYPSSTTLLVLSVMPTVVEQVNRRVKHLLYKNIVNIWAIGFSVFMAVGRLISGVHWFTDIVGGVILSAGLFTIYKAVVLFGSKEEN